MDILWIRRLLLGYKFSPNYNNIQIQHNPNENPNMFLENILGNPEIHKEMQRAKNN